MFVDQIKRRKVKQRSAAEMRNNWENKKPRPLRRGPVRISEKAIMTKSESLTPIKYTIWSARNKGFYFSGNTGQFHIVYGV